MSRNLFLIPFLLLVASCTHIKVIDPKPQEIGQVYQINPTTPWNGLNRSSFGTVPEQWTKDGLLLNGINFWHEIAEGDALLEASGVEYPKFSADMRPTEIQEFFVSTAVKAGAENVKASNLRPAKFGDAEGFRFDFTFTTPTGLKMRGMAVAAVIDNKLQMIEYWGAEAHYFDKNLDEAEKIFGSVQLI